MPTLSTVPAEPILHLETTNIQFKRILLAIDFSRQTPLVLSTAIQIARIFGSRLFLVNAATPAVYGTGAEPVPIETFDVNLQIAQARMTELVNSESALAAIHHEEIVGYATPLDLVQQVVSDKKIDLVIAGSHGASGMERLALGSVAECILRTVPCPVLVVGPNAALDRNLFSSILLASTLSPASLRSAQFASALAKHFHSRLTLLHVVEPNKHRVVQPELLERYTTMRLEELVPADFCTHASANPQIEYGKPGEMVVSLAACEHCTLVVTGARVETTLSDRAPWSTLGEIIRRAPCPVLCIRGHIA